MVGNGLILASTKFFEVEITIKSQSLALGATNGLSLVFWVRVGEFEPVFSPLR